MSVRKRPQGPLKHAQLVQVDGVQFYDKTRPPAVEDRSTDKPIRPRSLERQDGLSFKHQKDSRLWWTIALRQDLRLWPNDWVPGTEIKVPNEDGLRARGVL